MTTFLILLAAFAVMAASLAGAIFVSRDLSVLVERNLKVLLAFAAGVFAVITISLFREAATEGLPLPLIVVWALAGALFLELVSRLIPYAHHHHDARHEHAHSPIDARRMLLGDAAHNIGDGIILVPAFLADIWIGVATTFAVFLHEFIQEIAEFFVLREAGYTTKQALVRNVAVSSTILIGVGIALFAVSLEHIMVPLLAFAAGAFASILIRDLLPSIVRTVRMRGGLLTFTLAIFIGVTLMSAIQYIIPHEHGEEANAYDPIHIS